MLLLTAAPHVSSTGDSAAPRATRLLATAADGLLAVAFLLLAMLIAFIWLLVATRGGGVTPTSMQATVAWSLVFAAIPAWWGVLISTAVWDRGSGSTPGQLRAGLAVASGRGARLVRLMVHPLSALAWWWAAAVAALATVPVVPLVLASMGATAVSGGLVSAVMVAARPGSLALHDRVAGTRGPRKVEP